MANEIRNQSPAMRAAERVRAKREAERAQRTNEPITLGAPPITGTTSKVRARLNFMPDDSALASLIDQALSALSRGVRWARGSIINLVV